MMHSASILTVCYFVVFLLALSLSFPLQINKATSKKIITSRTISRSNSQKLNMAINNDALIVAINSIAESNPQGAVILSTVCYYYYYYYYYDYDI